MVGAVGWFLTGWTDGVEVEFIIDTGYQVTILATSVFERMCASDPRVRSRLRPCSRRLVSADSSPLTVRGELEMTVIFPDLSCEMLLVVASIGSDGLLGTEALQSCLPHRLDLQTGQLWVRVPMEEVPEQHPTGLPHGGVGPPLQCLPDGPARSRTPRPAQQAPQEPPIADTGTKLSTHVKQGRTISSTLGFTIRTLADHDENINQCVSHYNPIVLC